MKRYYVSFNCIYSEEVEADSPEEAAAIAEQSCPCDVDIDGLACVTDMETDEQYEV